MCDSATNDSGSSYALRHIRGALVVMVLAFSFTGCSVKQYGTKIVADALSGSGTVYASDDDIDLVGAATPFGLKVMESVLQKVPEHLGVLLAASRGFTQYAYAYVQLPAEYLEQSDPEAFYRELARAKRLYLRARDYALRGLDVKHPGFGGDLKTDPHQAAARATKDDIALLYWASVAWAAAISTAKDDPFLIADLAAVEALMERAYQLDEAFDSGALHVFMIGFEMSRSAVYSGAEQRAREHFSRALQLSDGLQAAPYIALAESVAVAAQDRGEFEQLLETAMEIDLDVRPEWRLANSLMQRRARHLLARADELFVE